MRVYLAASYRRKPDIAEAAAYLESRGIEVVSSWHREIYAPGIDIRTLATEVNQGIAEKDWEEILESDALILWTEDPNHQPPRGGRHVEFGIALALGKRLLVLGDRENIFHHLPQVEVLADLSEVKP
jgi:nucleoside 2-deoxyribosyltransferase